MSGADDLDPPPVGEPLVAPRRAGGPPVRPGGSAGGSAAWSAAGSAPQAPPTGVLQGRTVLVTGASAGPGAALAAALCDAGARVVLVDVGLDELRDRCTTLPEDRAMVLRCDLGSAEDVRAVGDFLARADLRLDAVVHAATVAVDGPVLDAPIEELDEHYLIGVRAPALLVQSLRSRLAPGARVVLVEGRRDPARAPGPEPLAADPGGSGRQMAAAARRLLAEQLRAELSPQGAVVVTAGWTGDAGDDEVADALVRFVCEGATLDVVDVTLGGTGPAQR